MNTVHSSPESETISKIEWIAPTVKTLTIGKTAVGANINTTEAFNYHPTSQPI